MLNASNKKVKEYRKADKSDLIYTTNIWPKDIGRWKLILFTIFFGLFGVNHYYIKRNKRATFSLVTTILSTTLSLVTAILTGGLQPIVQTLVNFLISYVLPSLAASIQMIYYGIKKKKGCVYKINLFGGASIVFK